MKNFVFCIYLLFFFLSQGCIFSYDDKKETKVIGNYYISSSGNYHSLIYKADNTSGANVILINVDSIGLYGSNILGELNNDYYLIDTSSQKIIEKHHGYDEFYKETKLNTDIFVLRKVSD